MRRLVGFLTLLGHVPQDAAGRLGRLTRPGDPASDHCVGVLKGDCVARRGPTLKGSQRLRSALHRRGDGSLLDAVSIA